MRKIFCLIAGFLFLSLPYASLFGAEESLDLETVVAPAPSTLATSSSTHGFHIMGRVDLTYEKTAGDKHSNQLRNNHFLLFLKVKASEKVSFMGEFMNETFYHVDLELNPTLKMTFGKIIVPFGDTRQFHRIYGGIPSLGIDGIMFPNVWASHGINLSKESFGGTWDAAVVNTFAKSGNDLSDPDFKAANTTVNNQAIVLRHTRPVASKVNTALSLYGSDYAGERSVYMYGADVWTEYGLIPGLQDLRFSAGIADAEIEAVPTTNPASLEKFRKKGDYVQIQSRHLSPVELRLRYGTYIDDSRIKSNKDSHSINIAGIWVYDVIRFQAEHQWNYEAVNEISNDLARLTMSLDF